MLLVSILFILAICKFVYTIPTKLQGTSSDKENEENKKNKELVFWQVYDELESEQSSNPDVTSRMEVDKTTISGTELKNRLTVLKADDEARITNITPPEMRTMIPKTIAIPPLVQYLTISNQHIRNYDTQFFPRVMISISRT